MTRNLIRTLGASIAALFVTAANAVPFWGDKASLPAETAPTALGQGQFVWTPQAAPSGPIVVVVSLTEQRAYAYRNGIRIGYTTVSTGKPGFQTPTGVFTTLQKDKDHHSSIYNNAAMPFTQRLTWGGVSLHAGGLPGYPSSHGCVHLPSEFARLLFDASPLGMTVVVGRDAAVPVAVAHPAALTPVDARSGAAQAVSRLSPDQAFRWEPEKASDGPVSLLLSAADRRVLVFRNGVEIGRARITVRDPGKALGTHVFTVVGPAAGAPKWIAVGVAGHAGEDKIPLDPAQAGRVTLPSDFAQALGPLLVPGTTMMVTDASVLESTTSKPLTVVTNEPPQGR